MYYYVYDSFLADKKFEGVLAKIEARLTDLGINGRIGRLSVLTSIKEMIESAIKNGTDTIVAVGNDETVNKLISVLPGRGVTIGYIPVVDHSPLANVLGIDTGAAACDVLSARIIEKIDLGRVNDSYFLSSLTIPAGRVVIFCNNKYSITSLAPDSTISIQNFGPHPKSNPKDGRLETIIAPVEKGLAKLFKKQRNPTSVFCIKRAVIRSEGESLPVIADGQNVIKTPVTVEVAPARLKMIVGKNRAF